MKTIHSEFAAGESNGMKHGSPIPHFPEETCRILYAQNEEKARAGQNAEEPLIRAYWQGYLSGMQKAIR